MLVNLITTFDTPDRRWFAGENPDVDASIATQWIANGWATADVTPPQALPVAAASDSGLSGFAMGALPRNTTILFGDSTTDRNNITPQNALSTYSSGYMTWANILLGDRQLTVVAELGVGSETTIDMLVRLEAAAAVRSDWAVVVAGLNDLVGSFAAPEDVQGRLELIYTRLRLSGKKVIAGAIAPVKSTHPSFSRKLAARVIQVNQWIASFCRTHAGMVFVDIAGPVTDVTSADGNPITNAYIDDAHQAPIGAFEQGYAIYTAVRDQLVPVNTEPASVGDSYLAAQSTITSLTGNGVTATATLATHGLKAGDKITIEGATPAGYNGSYVVASAPTTGTFTYASSGSGAATGTIKVSNNDQLLDNPLFGTPSAGLASGWAIAESNTTTTPTTSARSNGRGNWQQLAIVASAAGNSTLQAADQPTRVFAGDTVVAEFAVEVDAAHTNLLGLQLNLQLFCNGVLTIPIGNYRTVGFLLTAEGWTGIIRTIPFTLPAGAVAQSQFKVIAYFNGAGSATIRVGGASYRKVR